MRDGDVPRLDSTLLICRSALSPAVEEMQVRVSVHMRPLILNAVDLDRGFHTEVHVPVVRGNEQTAPEDVSQGCRDDALK